jgi:flavin-dependent dehydrogenase
LEDGAHIAVIGGGPAGSFFSIFALKMAKMIGKEIHLTIYEPKDFTKEGPPGCNRCGGIISELLVQTLALEGINLPDTLVQKGINSYKLHTTCGNVFIATPSHEKTIATIHRGGGPQGVKKDKKSFDQFLLDMAVTEGALHEAVKIDRIDCSNSRPVLYSRGRMLQKPDLVVGAIGVKSKTSRVFEETGFGYKRPKTITAAIAEIGFEPRTISAYFGNSVHLFLLPLRNIQFAAMIPKGTYITVCLLGKDLTTHTMNEFISHPVVKSVLPDPAQYTLNCHCLPQMNVGAARVPFRDRIVMCGDAGSTRLYKDGMGAAYLMGKAAAKAAVFQGVGRRHFEEVYSPVYKSIVNDNQFGKLLFAVTDLFKKNSVLTKSMLGVVRREQDAGDGPKILSSVLWDLFTGNERYKNIFRRSVSIPLFYELLKGVGGNLRG